MPYYMYVAVQGDNKISVFTVDPDSGGMTLQTDVPVSGGPFTMAISPDRRYLYVGCREITQLVSFEIDQASGGLTQNGSVPAGLLARVRGHRPQGQVRAVVLLPGRPRGGAPHRR